MNNNEQCLALTKERLALNIVGAYGPERRRFPLEIFLLITYPGLRRNAAPVSVFVRASFHATR